jgi:hypothetical protein
MRLLKDVRLFIFFCLITMLTGCSSPEVGSTEWCEDMKEKPQGIWTERDFADYGKYCIIEQGN